MANIPQEFNNFFLKDVSFVNLMTRRIFNVLIVANPYDAFMLEDDGRVDEKVFDEYTELGMRYPPTFTQVSTTEEAGEVLKTTDIDLVICMPGNADNDAFTVAREVKQAHPQLPCVVLTPFSHGITRRMQDEDMSIFDYVFCWLGNTNLILSIIKLIEDRMNLEHDIREAGVQMILLVEDNIRFYSSILPNLYNYILAQSKRFSTEALNPHAAAQRKRGRPKVVLATNYEEAWHIYEHHRDNVLGVISDTRFPVQTPVGRLSHVEEGDAEAGLRLLQAIREADEFVPLILQSSETGNRQKAWDAGFDFLDKNSKKFNVDLRNILEEHLGFGDFIFRDPETKQEVARVSSLKELQDNIFKIPHDSLMHHIRRNHMSRWLCARAIFPVSNFLRHVTWHKLQDVDAHRQIIFDAIVQYRRMKNIGEVAVFDRKKFDRFAHFARIGDGSLGGKGRGLAFLDKIVKRHPELQLPGASVQIPKTVVLCTDFFDNFMDENNLWGIALSDAPDEEILRHFLEAQLPDDLIEDFFIFFEATKKPIAVRSSSLLEDSHYQPFAGIYATYMIPWLDDKYTMLRMLACAIKSVYASVYYRDSKAYMTATQNVIDQEKMAVILQEVVGQQHGDLYYPTFSGVLRSLNYYPIGDETAEEGIASLALGLGKYIVDGGQTLRVSPYHPTQVLQMSEMELALRDTQTRFYALDMKPKPTPNPSQGEGRADTSSPDTSKLSNLPPLPSGGAGGGFSWSVDDGFNIKNVRVKQADQDGALHGIASTYDPIDQVIRPGIYEGGRKVISFCGVLEQGIFPLPELLQLSQKLGAEEMRRPVEIEFACNLGPTSSPSPGEGRWITPAMENALQGNQSPATENALQGNQSPAMENTLQGNQSPLPLGGAGAGLGAFYLLQIRPIVDSKQVLDEDLQKIPDPECLLRSNNSLGHGISEDVVDVVYVKTPDDFTAAANPQIAVEIEQMNRHFLETGTNYVLIGPGRWGSSDPWLGIPVKWPHISASRLIVEVGLKNYHVDPSQGTHFFQNLTSFGVGYFTLNTYTGDGVYQKEVLDRMEAIEETEHVRHVRFQRPLKIMMDGKKQTGVALLPRP